MLLRREKIKRKKEKEQYKPITMHYLWQNVIHFYFAIEAEAL